MCDLAAVGIRSYVAEPDRGRRDWSKAPAAKTPVYANRRRIRGARGQRLMRKRGERIERSFAHLYDTGGMRRTHLRGHANILKRLLIYAGGFNLGLVIRHLVGSGTPRGLQDRLAPVMAALLVLLGPCYAAARDLSHGIHSSRLYPGLRRHPSSPSAIQPRNHFHRRLLALLEAGAAAEVAALYERRCEIIAAAVAADQRKALPIPENRESGSAASVEMPRTGILELIERVARRFRAQSLQLLAAEA